MPILAPQEYEKNPLYLRPGETPDQYKVRTSKRPASSLSGTMKEAPASDPVSSFSNFAAALNKAVSLARNQRQSADLDMLGKQIKPGSVSASSFTSLLSDINSASSRFSDPLVQSATDMAAQEQARLQQEKSSIRDLALSLATQGISQETIQGLLAAPSIDVALPIATAALSSKAKEGTFERIGNSIVRLRPDGSTEEIYTAPTVGDKGGDLTPSQIFSQVNTLRDDVRNDPDVKDFITVRDGYERVQTGEKLNNAQGDLSLLFGYMKLLDPNSVVRETEFANAEAAMGYAQQILNIPQKFFNGNRLTEEGRKQFGDAANAIYASKKTNYDKAIQFYNNSAQTFGIDPTMITRDYGSNQAPEPAPVRTATEQLNEVVNTPPPPPEQKEGFFDSFLSVFGL